jgi:hypothetical protein
MRPTFKQVRSQRTHFMPNTPPFMCTLPARDYAARLSSIAALNRSFLRGHHREEHTLELTYAPEAAPLVRELVQHERECCASLEFTIVETTDEILLRIEAPANAVGGAALLFAAFLAAAALTRNRPSATGAPPRER